MTSLNEFWELMKPEDDGYLEIRLTPVSFISLDEQERLSDDAKQTLISSRKTIFWSNLNELKRFMGKNFGTPSNKVSLFVRTLEEFKQIYMFNDGYFRKNGKPCYGINLRYKNEMGELNGSYECVKEYRFFYLDVDGGVDYSEDNFESELFRRYINSVVNSLKKYGLYHPSIISSGGGVHLIYKIKPQTVINSRKLWMKDFCDNLNLTLSNKHYTVDSLHDATRITALPGTVNVKRGKDVKVINISNYVCENFKIKYKKQLKPKNLSNQKVNQSVKNSLEFRILAKGVDVPKGERNNVLVYSLKTLLKDTGTNYEPFEKYLRQFFPVINLNPSQGVDGKYYNKGVVINWCKKNMKWLRQHPDLLKLYEEYINNTGDLDEMELPENVAKYIL